MHDQLCEYLSITVDGVPHSIDRTRCDELLYETLDIQGSSPQERSAIVGAVDLYRTMAHITSPSNSAMKRALEAKWVY